MRKVTHEYSVELDWAESYVNQLNGYMEDGFMIIPDSVSSGTRYVYSIDEDISVFFTDVIYHEDVQFKIRNKKKDFVALYFNLTEDGTVMVLDDICTPIGSWAYNMTVVDGGLNADYILKSGSKIFILCIFIKKCVFRDLMFKLNRQSKVIDDTFNPSINTIIQFDNMSSYSWWLINELRKIPTGGALFELFCAGVVHRLIAEYLDCLKDKEVILERMEEADILNIFSSQNYLIEKSKDTFPGILCLANRACMSLTKYKKVFRKVTGDTPNIFFVKNKMIHVKKVVEEGGLTIGEIADEFNFASAAHLSKMFRKHFGVGPKEYQKGLWV